MSAETPDDPHADAEGLARRAAVYAETTTAYSDMAMVRPGKVRGLVVYVRTLQNVSAKGTDEPFALCYKTAAAALDVEPADVKAWMECLRLAGLCACIRSPAGKRSAEWLWLGWDGAKIPRLTPVSWFQVKRGSIV